MTGVTRIASLGIATIALLALPGCSGETEPAPASAPAETPSPPQPAPPVSPIEPAPPAKPATKPIDMSAADAEAGMADYQLYCASCHGAKGGGDGPIAQALDPQPARHNDAAVMNALTNDYLFRVIKEGGQAVGKSPMMAPWGGSLSDEQILNLVAFIRWLAEPPYAP